MKEVGEQARQVPGEGCFRQRTAGLSYNLLLLQDQSDQSRDLEPVLLTLEFPREPAAFSFSVSEQTLLDSDAGML